MNFLKIDIQKLGKRDYFKLKIGFEIEIENPSDAVID